MKLGKGGTVLFSISMGQYYKFIESFIKSANRSFWGNDYLRIFLMLDDCGGYQVLEDVETQLIRTNFDIFTQYVPRLPWPMPTLLRYHLLRDTIVSYLDKFDYMCYSDIDTKFVKDVMPDSDMVSDLTVCHHFAYPPNNEIYRTYFEDRPESAAYVKNPPDNYYLGGFWFGTPERIYDLANSIIEMVNYDLKNHIIAKWHDESYLNKYLIENPPEKALPYNFAAPLDTGYKGMTIVDLNAGKSFKELRDW